MKKPDRVKKLFLTKKGNKLDAPDMLSFEETNRRIWELGADIFIPGAASKLVTRQQVDALIAGGIEVIACGANVPFVDDGVFFGPTAKYADSKFSLIPDFIANCGMARVFGYLMGDGDVLLEDSAIFNDTSDCIRAAMERCHARSPERTGLSSTGLSIALEQLL